MLPTNKQTVSAPEPAVALDEIFFSPECPWSDQPNTKFSLLYDYFFCRKHTRKFSCIIYKEKNNQICWVGQDGWLERIHPLLLPSVPPSAATLYLSFFAVNLPLITPKICCSSFFADSSHIRGSFLATSLSFCLHCRKFSQLSILTFRRNRVIFPCLQEPLHCPPTARTHNLAALFSAAQPHLLKQSIQETTHTHWTKDKQI